ncbi:heme exporter protein D [Nicoletella semolina]|uniref:Heme exporter protein D n=1 Tax=Nicoletella semolina TaxID=271160 RepID=A0A4R2N6L1_9PAST|nr:heme exporter protein CcmD [Nicoletella semolina]MDH2925165.1 heme exporter protein CcmD [Nicoletella semolina]TCP16524.1 heme exporter protein D [Nicoletella semolina]
MQLQFQFQSIADFFLMGEYGFFVWLSYGVTFFICGGLIWQILREPKQILKQVKKEATREQLRKKNRQNQ